MVAILRQVGYSISNPPGKSLAGSNRPRCVGVMARSSIISFCGHSAIRQLSRRDIARIPPRAGWWVLLDKFCHHPAFVKQVLEKYTRNGWGRTRDCWKPNQSWDGCKLFNGDSVVPYHQRHSQIQVDGSDFWLGSNLCTVVQVVGQGEGNLKSR